MRNEVTFPYGVTKNRMYNESWKYVTSSLIGIVLVSSTREVLFDYINAIVPKLEHLIPVVQDIRQIDEMMWL